MAVMKATANVDDRASAPLTLLVLHAHPDDECLGAGGTLAKYAAAGVRTVLVTATLGEEGEIHDPDLTEEEARPRLAEIRRGELARATALLNVGTQEFLGYRDSGMMGTPANAHPANFHNAKLGEATGRLVALIRRHRPQVLVSYNVDGGYGHPDHLQCYRVTFRAFDAAGDPQRYPEAGPAWQPLKFYAIAWSRERWQQLQQAMAERGIPWFFGSPPDDEGPTAEGERTAPTAERIEPEAGDRASEPDEEEEVWGQPEDSITTFIDTRDYWQLPLAALRQHRTQFAPDSGFLNLPDDLAALVRSREYFVLLRSRVATTRPENDLFAGLRS